MSEQIEDLSYDFSTLSGQGTLTLSGQVKLHSIVVNRATSGQVFDLYNSSSGQVNIIGKVAAGSELEAPRTLLYDVRLTNGLVLVTTGALWNLIVTYKK